MSETSRSQITERLRDSRAVTEAIQRGVREAVLAHARAGRPVAAWREGKVVWIPPEEILRTLENPDSR